VGEGPGEPVRWSGGTAWAAPAQSQREWAGGVPRSKIEAVAFETDSKSIQIQWFKTIQIIPNFDRAEMYFSVLGKIKIKYGFKGLENMNNFLHRNFFRFRRDLE
jgi:hypothetical protein